MPRADSKQHLGTQFYHSQFSNSPYLSESPSSSPQLSPTSHSAPSSAPATTSAPKKKHVCSTCERAFTTSGHLARHSRVHTGERNHKCPFPGCETRCSRQDNLQQQLVFVLADIPVFPVSIFSIHEHWLVFFFTSPVIEFTCLLGRDEVRHVLLPQKRWMGRRGIIMQPQPLKFCPLHPYRRLRH